MMFPSKTKDDLVIYECMRSTLIFAIVSKIKSIVIPTFGCACGLVEHGIIVKRMKEGYNNLVNHL